MKIVSEDDIRQWAETIVAAKGGKFIPLSKSDMFHIAQWIISRQPPIDVDESETPTPTQESDTVSKVIYHPVPESLADELHDKTIPYIPPEKGLHFKADIPQEDCRFRADTPMDIPQGIKPQQYKRVVTRPATDISPQQAFDKFLEWQKSSPRRIMDFFTGKICTEAAFAYWLFTGGLENQDSPKETYTADGEDGNE